MRKELPPTAGSAVLYTEGMDRLIHPSRLVSYYATLGIAFTHGMPAAISLVNSSTPYVYDPRTQTYGQPAFAQQLLKRFVDVNETLVQGLSVQGAYPFEERTIDNTSSLLDLIKFGIEAQHQAPTVLGVLFTELAQQTKCVLLPPHDLARVLIDSAGTQYCSRLMTSRLCTVSRSTATRTSKLSRATTLDYLGLCWSLPAEGGLSYVHVTTSICISEGSQGHQKRGVFLGALSTQNTTFSAPLELVEALGLQPTVPSNPYVHRSPELVQYAKGLRNFPVPEQLTVDEAASIFDVWQSINALHISTCSFLYPIIVAKGIADRGDEMFLSKYTEAGGNAREFVQRGLLQTVAM